MDMCHCGRPLHYTDPEVEAAVRKLVAETGEYVIVRVGQNGKGYLVQRHYMALHGIRAVDLPSLGFEEVP